MLVLSLKLLKLVQKYYSKFVYIGLHVINYKVTYCDFSILSRKYGILKKGLPAIS